ncbi:archaellar assembly protein FlaJ [Methanococcoides burtonii]|uniref:Type II secretion system protein F domain n=1 Tax=Methanococcoides burtonii (strain DSM 6242 / NBRC 107633 / OCM 468 / ACE-M) TaxID=259564 RepID=Q12YX8_METBU|nr:archaellar assembly protein FlaJ [Methanococcoides burtonii]ABE51348.1 type II secretion system protein F domain [Methanococcoides burtonii DSM 6242]
MDISGLKNIFKRIDEGNSSNSLSKMWSRKVENFKKDLYISNDMLFSLTYMASISTANVSRDKIFTNISEKTEYCPHTYFKKVKDLAQDWHYDYAQACELVSVKIKNAKLHELFNRFSNSIASGEPDVEFLKKEWKLFKTIRKDEFERNLETTKEWSNAYTALLVSTSLVSIIVLLSVILYNLGEPSKTLYGTAFIVSLMSFGGVALLFKGVPRDSMIHSLDKKSKEQTYIYKWLPVTIIFSVLSVVTLTLIPSFFYPVDFYVGIKGFGMILAGLIMLPVGLAARTDVIKVNKRDESYTTFIRSLGSIVSGSGLTLPKALMKIDPKNLGELREITIELHRKLTIGMDSKLCWNQFVEDSGSYLIHKFTSVFVDSINLGGDAEAVGELVSSSNLELVLLRMKRERISASFTFLVVPLHLAMVALLLFIGQILMLFTNIISELFTKYDISESAIAGGAGGVSMNLGIFGGVPVELLGQFVVVVIIVLTLGNVLAVNLVKGGPLYLLVFYGSIFFIFSGIMMLIVPPVVDIFFSFDSFMDGGI